MTAQAEISGGRLFRVGTVGHAAAPVDGDAGTAPDFTASPETRLGIKTTGLRLILKSPSAGGATAVGAGFTVTAWIRDPVCNVWGSGASVAMHYNEAWVCYDIDASEMYFQIAAASVAADGNIDFCVAEQ